MAMETDVTRLGTADLPNPLLQRREHFISDEARVLIASTLEEIKPFLEAQTPPPSFELAGPRQKIHFDPQQIACGVVTCGGLCPGLNDVIRSLVLSLTYSYGVKQIYGFRYGYAGIAASQGIPPLELTPEAVQDIHDKGGTLLGSSRGPQDIGDMLKTLTRLNIRILFTIGGDGTLRGASRLAEEIERRGLDISVIGIPKTIDNDLNWVERSFGFATAVEEATRALEAAHAEARGAFNGIGLVKLMGRHSGFITAHATLANGDVNFCLIPEAPFNLEAFLDELCARVQHRHHAVIALAEGAGQDWMSGDSATDASGNAKLKDIGAFLRHAIEQRLNRKEIEYTVKYIDPSYIIRSVRANAIDSEYCLALGQHAAHAGMSGRTNMMVGFWNQHFTHVPLPMAIGKRRQVEISSELWQRVLASTGQPSTM